MSALIRIRTLASDAKYKIEQLLESSLSNLVEAEISSKLLFGAWIAIIVSVSQLVVMFFATIKSKANNVVLENTPEAKVAKYCKMLKEGVLTQK